MALSWLSPVIGRIGGALFTKLTGRAPRAPIVDSTGNPSAEFQSTLSRSGLSFEDVIDATSNRYQ